MTQRVRVSQAEMLAALAGKPAASHGSKRGSQGATTGTCTECGQKVTAAQPADFRTTITDGHATHTVKHLRTQDCQDRQQQGSESAASALEVEASDMSGASG